MGEKRRVKDDKVSKTGTTKKMTPFTEVGNVSRSRFKEVNKDSVFMLSSLWLFASRW